MTTKKKRTIPKFLVCSTHEEPDRNFILHSHHPRFIAEVLNDFNNDIIDSIRNDGVIFTKVRMDENYFDILVLLEFTDFIDLTKNANFNKVHDIMEEMSKWHYEEVSTLITLANKS